MPMRRVRRTICIMAAAGAALSSVPACAGEVVSKRQASRAEVRATLLNLILTDSGASRSGPANAHRMNANLCGDCSFERESVRQFLPGDMTLKFRPVGGTFSFHF
jgi:hypothetical protein